MMYSVLLVLALAAQGYARPNCYLNCDYPMGQVQPPVQPIYPAPRGDLVQPGLVDVFRPTHVQPVYPQPPRMETFQPAPVSSGHMTFNHESQASHKTSISGTYTYGAPSPQVNEPIRYPSPPYQPIQQYPSVQSPCRLLADCS